jgi:ribosomal-protein-alanine N-acetyltransferase
LTSIEEARELFAERPLADYERYGFGRWACVLKATGEVIGGAGLKYCSRRPDLSSNARSNTSVRP